MEEELAEHLKQLAEQFHGLPPVKCRQLAFEYAEKNNIPIPANWTKAHSAGGDWFGRFLVSRHLSVRTPQATSLGRATAFNKTTVGEFFDNLAAVMDRHTFPPHMIYNVDETGVFTVQKPQQTGPLNCRLNTGVPVLQRFFASDDTREDFRLSRESLAVLLGLLHQERRHGWGATIETLVLLFWLASGASYRVVSRVFGMPRSTVHRIVHRVTEEVGAIRHRVIYLPRSADDLAAVTQGFAGLARHRAFLKAAGAIDGCHVRIKSPSGPDGHCYINRILFASIILQAVCDHQGRFIDTYLGWPGSVHDARVLRHSPLYRQNVYPPPGHFILADSRYPCLQHPLPLITPYRLPVRGVVAQRFNGHHARARSVIERAFGMMKTRFRAIFLKALEIRHTFVPQVITCDACAVLHNICLGACDTMAPEEDVQDGMPGG
ncbi:protein ALP1-like isoform X1 [Xyrichtys novacula]|uniref:Protein ALP1-like isoform X1 n=1 Tax=Xyrichtys novacula TaxID=13765 RepID=A0AAV1FFB0_XYRNO|nr:protein ALP1-like isoform X1 [Xyrichtys novacula]